MKSSTRNHRTFLKASGAAAASLAAQSVLAETPRPNLVEVPAASMPARNLGKTGHKVALFSLGGQAAFEHLNNEAVAIPIIERALDLGVNYIDTSSIYGGPSRPSERYIRTVMKTAAKKPSWPRKQKNAPGMPPCA